MVYHDVPRLSDAEWEVMLVLWDDSPLTSADVVERVAGRHDWSPHTVKTLLRRLVDKGALTYRQQANRYLYRPAVGRDKCLREASRSFLNKVFAGDAAGMLAHLVDEVDLTDEQIRELRRLLQKKGGR